MVETLTMGTLNKIVIQKGKETLGTVPQFRVHVYFTGIHLLENEYVRIQGREN